MKWSYSTSRMFLHCPRKWYYYEVVASPTAKNPLRREAYLLKQLQTVYAWRGSLVDTIIEKLIVPGINSKNMPSEDSVIASSLDLMDRQLQFGKEKKYRHCNATKSNIGDEYCAFFDVEYNGGLDERTIQEAKEDVIISLKNLMHSDFLNEIVINSSYAIAQRQITFRFEGINVSCTPDLLIFYRDNPPLIVDWKVHTFANADYWLQLGIYAIALSRTKPHRDFPENIESQIKDPKTFRLVEYQLLKNKQREYSLSPKDIADIEDYIFLSYTRMENLLNGKKFKELDLEHFRTAYSPEICFKWQFRKLCWRKMFVQKSLFEVSWT